MPPVRRPVVIVLAAVVAAVVVAYALILRSGGEDGRVEAQLQRAADTLGPFPRPIDEATEMIGARAEGRRMTYVYRLLQAVPVEAERHRAHMERTVCAAETMRAAMQEGVVFVYEYRAKDDPAEVLARIEIGRCP